MEASLIKAFSQDPSQGNPAGVIFMSNELTDERLGSIASDIGFSESVFIYPSDRDDTVYNFRYFTKGEQEVPLCGHATLAAAKAIYDRDKFNSIYVNTESGKIKLIFDNGSFYMESNSHVIDTDTPYSKEIIAKLLNINKDDILDYPLVTASIGAKPKLMIPIKNLSAIQSLKPDFGQMIQFCTNHPVFGFYVFTTECINARNNFHARQFNPAAGIEEDPQTGVAAGALAIYSRFYGIDKSDNYIIEQGYEMKMPGLINVEVDDDIILVGGKCVVFGSKEL